VLFVSDLYRYCSKDMGCRCHLVRQILDNVTEGLSAQNACLQFVATGNLASISDKEGSDEVRTYDLVTEHKQTSRQLPCFYENRAA